MQEFHLFIALLAAVFDLLIGVTYGGVSAYYGGKVDIIMQRIIEIISGVPSLVIVTLFIMVFEPGIMSILWLWQYLDGLEWLELYVLMY